MSSTLDNTNLYLERINEVSNSRRDIELTSKEKSKVIGNLEALKASKVAKLHEIERTYKASGDVTETPAYKKLFEEIVNVNKDIDNNTRLYTEKLKELTTFKNALLDGIIPDNMYFLGYIGGLYSGGNSTFTYKKKEYVIPHFNNDTALPLMNVDLYFKEVLKDLGFGRVYTADDKPYKRFASYTSPVLASRKNNNPLRPLSIYQYKELIFCLIWAYLLQSGDFMLDADERGLNRI